MTPEPLHPGIILRRELKERGLTQKQLAEMLSRHKLWVCNIVIGRKNITAEYALDLELALGIPAEKWMQLQSEFDISKARKIYNKKLSVPEPRKYTGGKLGHGKIEFCKEAIIALSKNYTNYEIAKMLGFSDSGVQKALERWGIKRDA